MKANKLFRISEIGWLIVCIICILTDLYIFIFLRDTQRGILFLAMTFMSGLMYFIRRRMRIRADLALNENNSTVQSRKKN